jgi:hypothetical protein
MAVSGLNRRGPVLLSLLPLLLSLLPPLLPPAAAAP